MLPTISNKQAYGAMMSRGKGGGVSSGHNEEETQSRGTGVISRKGPGISSLKNRIPPVVANNNSSVSGAGFNSQMPYKGPGANSLNTNVFNIPKYGSGGLGGIGGGIGSTGLGGGIGGGYGGSGIGNYGGFSNSNKDDDGNFGGRYKF
jgi:hypothetical protein